MTREQARALRGLVKGIEPPLVTFEDALDMLERAMELIGERHPVHIDRFDQEDRDKCKPCALLREWRGEARGGEDAG